jgi:two-component system LytT family response regulator
MFTCYVIEDEDHALEKILGYISQHENLQLVNSFKDPLKALSYILIDEVVDIIFMDIEMPEMNGIELAKRIRHKTKKLVISSGHSKYGYNAFEVEADAFLLKPYSFTKFEATINKLLLKEEQVQKIEDFIFVKYKDKPERVKIKIDEIMVIEAKLHSVKIDTISSSIETNIGFSEIKYLLSNHLNLLQVHRSFIIFLKHISSIERNRIKMTDNRFIPIGKKYRCIVDTKILRKSDFE